MNRKSLFLAVAWATAASATQFVPENELIIKLARPGYTPAWEGLAAPYDAEKVYEDGIAFIEYWQVKDPLSPDYGGIIEGENMTTVIQSDNTQESVWVWSRWRELTGKRTYDDATERSWTYLANFPAWMEEGWPAQKYYRFYNCGWGMRAELTYRRATGDASHRDYGDACAAFVTENEIVIDTSLINYFSTAWAVGNLYNYAVDVGDEELRAKALEMAEEIKTLAEQDPATRIGGATWALSGGTTIWALHESYFREHAGEEAAWMATYAPYMPDLMDPGILESDNAWNAWFMLGHYIAYHATDDDAYWDKFENVASFLANQDTDGDGGIPPSVTENDTHDHTWVTSYLCYMGMDRILRDLSVRNLAAAPALGEMNLAWVAGTEYGAAGYDVYREKVGTFGRPRLNDAPLTGFGEMSFRDGAVLPGETYHYWVEAASPGENTKVYGPVVAQGGVYPCAFSLGQNYPNPSAGRTTIPFSISTAAEATLKVYDLGGREVYATSASYGAGKHAVSLELSLPPGVYLYRLTAGGGEGAKKLVISD